MGGQVDAFVSHSWHDEADSKWKLLQQWRGEFRQRNQGREPKLWIDKYCIDQKNIEDSLACLPVYLAGCKSLLILCGKTYTDRLWCVIELFVFLEMGGRVENLEVRFLDEETQIALTSTYTNTTSNESIGVILERFDPRESTCFSEYDTQRLQAVVEACGYDRISALVREAFLAKRWNRGSRNTLDPLPKA